MEPQAVKVDVVDDTANAAPPATPARAAARAAGQVMRSPHTATFAYGFIVGIFVAAVGAYWVRNKF